MLTWRLARYLGKTRPVGERCGELGSDDRSAGTRASMGSRDISAAMNRRSTWAERYRHRAHARPNATDARRREQLAELVAKGAGGTPFLETDDCQSSFDELTARGVVFNDPPTPQPYGIDTSFRDPSGNNIRLTQVLESSMDRR